MALNYTERRDETRKSIPFVPYKFVGRDSTHILYWGLSTSTFHDQRTKVRDLYHILRAQHFRRCLFSSRKRERFRDTCFSLFPFSNLHLQLYEQRLLFLPSYTRTTKLGFLEKQQKRCTRMLFHEDL